VSGLLDGMRILDAGIWRPVPHATQLLADLDQELSGEEGAARLDPHALQRQRRLPPAQPVHDPGLASPDDDHVGTTLVRQFDDGFRWLADRRNVLRLHSESVELLARVRQLLAVAIRRVHGIDGPGAPPASNENGSHTGDDKPRPECLRHVGGAPQGAIGAIALVISDNDGLQGFLLSLATPLSQETAAATSRAALGGPAPQSQPSQRIRAWS